MESLPAKRLYVVSSLHYTTDPEVNRENAIEDIQEVRFNVIKAIARTLRRGGYFSDGFSFAIASEAQHIIEKDSLPKLQDMRRDTQKSGDFYEYEFLRTVEVMKKLRTEAVDFDFKPTENVENDKREFLRFYWQKLKQDPEFQKLHQAGKEKKEELLDHIERKTTEFRDRDIVQNIVQFGETQNILYIGSDHKLKDLQSTPEIESYRLEVARDADRIVVRGIIPESFKEKFKKLRRKTTQGRNVVKAVEYV